MSSHTSGVISLCTGAVLCKSAKQKINTKSSTEAELVGATNFAPNTIWSKKFLEAQGHLVETNILEQDNVSTIRLEKNGKSSAGRQSRHIDIRYFFLKDRVKQDNITIRHCPTEAMLADFLTKPLQGQLFKKFRDVLMGLKHTNTLLESIGPNTSSSRERVGNNEKNENHNLVRVLVQVPGKENERKESSVREMEAFGNNPTESSGEWVEKDEGSTGEQVEPTWSLVSRKKQNHYPDTGNHRTKNENVYKLSELLLVPVLVQVVD
jgi:hypothetical protein